MNLSIHQTINLLLCSLFLSGCEQAVTQTVVLSAPAKKDFYHNLITTPLSSNPQILLGVLPHHEVAKAWISEFWATIAINPPRTLIIISPNHFDIKKEKIITSQNRWKTEVGDVFSNQDLIKKMTQLPFITIDNQAVLADHGVAIHIPYIAHFLPKTKIVPLLVSNYVDQDEMNTLIAVLMQNLDPQTDMVIASIDFSHYLSKTESEKKDEITKHFIETNDTNHIINLNNDYLDARSGMVLIQQLAKQLQCKEPTFFHHGNSADFLHGPTNSTTSYFVIGYTANNCQKYKQ